MRHLAIVSLLLMTACQSSEEKKTEWVKFCVDGEFTIKQCNVLYSLKESSDDANNSASSAAILSGAAIGMSAGGRR